MGCNHKFLVIDALRQQCVKCGEPKFTPETGETRKRAGMARVLANPQAALFRRTYWSFAWKWITSRPRSTHFLFEQITADYRRNKLPAPHHCNALGAIASSIVKEAVNDGIIIELPTPVRSVVRSNNARKATVYVRC